MVPLDKARPGADPRGPIVVRKPVERPPADPAPRKPRRFKIVDVMTRQTLAEDVDTRTTVEVLEPLRSVVDVNIYIWDDAAGAWEQLSQGDRRRLWELRGRVKR